MRVRCVAPGGQFWGFVTAPHVRASHASTAPGTATAAPSVTRYTVWVLVIREGYARSVADVYGWAFH